MMCVKTKIAKSKIQGMGIFADEFIPKGKIIWKFTEGFDLKFTEEQIKNFPKQVQEYLQTYTWLSKKTRKYCLSSDNGKYFNHSEKPNSLSAYYDDEDEVITKALRDIQKGEEITDNYDSFAEDYSLHD